MSAEGDAAQQARAFDELARLSLDDGAPAAPASSDAERLAAKENINVVFIGHVDAGKSTLGGQILFQTGMVDKRTLEKFERESREMNRESWYLSWALDTGDEERAKGITVECGRAFFETARRRFTILDAPGHKNYVPSMISGAAQSDVALLVISARRGEFETGFEKGGQTREHATLVKTLGVRRLVVVVNKMDDPSVGWAKERWDEIVDKLSPFLRANGFNLRTDVAFVPVSGLRGTNVKCRAGADVVPWYDGPALLEFLDEMPGIERRADAPLLMPVSGKYREMGTIVTGKLESGSVRRGQAVLLMPNRQAADVLAVFIEEAEVPAARAGDNVRLRLRGVEEDEVHTGFVVCDAARPVAAAASFSAQIAVLQIKSILAPGFRAVLHIHTASEEVTVAGLEATLDRKTGERAPKRPMFLRSGDVAVVTLEAAAPVCLAPSAPGECESLARFTLRDEGRTIAVGKVLRVLD